MNNEFRKWFAARARNPDRITLEEAFNAGKQSVPSVPEVTDAMAIAFHAALTDGSIGQQEAEEIKTGLRAALAAISEAKP